MVPTTDWLTYPPHAHTHTHRGFNGEHFDNKATDTLRKNLDMARVIVDLVRRR